MKKNKTYQAAGKVISKMEALQRAITPPKEFKPTVDYSQLTPEQRKLGNSKANVTRSENLVSRNELILELKLNRKIDDKKLTAKELGSSIGVTKRTVENAVDTVKTSWSYIDRSTVAPGGFLSDSQSRGKFLRLLKSSPCKLSYKTLKVLRDAKDDNGRSVIDDLKDAGCEPLDFDEFEQVLKAHGGDLLNQKFELRYLLGVPDEITTPVNISQEVKEVVTAKPWEKYDDPSQGGLSEDAKRKLTRERTLDDSVAAIERQTEMVEPTKKRKRLDADGMPVGI